MLNFHFQGVPDAYRPGLEAVIPELQIALSEDGVLVQVQREREFLLYEMGRNLY